MTFRDISHLGDGLRGLHPANDVLEGDEERVLVAVRHDRLQEHLETGDRHLVLERLRCQVDHHRRTVRVVVMPEVEVEQAIDVVGRAQ